MHVPVQIDIQDIKQSISSFLQGMNQGLGHPLLTLLDSLTDLVLVSANGIAAMIFEKKALAGQSRGIDCRNRTYRKWATPRSERTTGLLTNSMPRYVTP